LKFLIDMNLSPRWVETLEKYGYPSIHWSSVGRPDALDSEVLTFAQENNYVLLTHDLDFGAILASSLGVSPSVVQIRALNLDPDAVMAKVVNAIEKVAEDLKAGALVIVQPGSTRARILPIKARPL
jgi:predicted nuclease of predicted toxin-antitoxin system